MWEADVSKYSCGWPTDPRRWDSVDAAGWGRYVRRRSLGTVPGARRLEGWQWPICISLLSLSKRWRWCC